VHAFLRRHVYSASKVHTSRPVATIITFLISALAHELVMGCITRKFRGYGFFAMMLQMPIVMVQRSKWVKGRTLLNNVLFWCSMILGLSMVSGQARITYRAVLILYRCVLFMSWCKGGGLVGGCWVRHVYSVWGGGGRLLRDTLLSAIELY
jgi:hypothetical protein